MTDNLAWKAALAHIILDGKTMSTQAIEGVQPNYRYTEKHQRNYVQTSLKEREVGAHNQDHEPQKSKTVFQIFKEELGLTS